MSPVFFEGPEKKVELAVVDDYPSLRGLGRAYWERVVSASCAQVLSVISNECVDAYLLSESSLFVYDNYVIMITCGQTRLVDAVFCMLETIPQEALALLVYERKNEHFPHCQPTSFFEDAQRLCGRVPGRALQFGVEHEHAVRVFHSSRSHVPDADDRTLEVLMHGIDADVAKMFGPASAPVSGLLADQLGLNGLLDGFVLDEYLFEPAGYSLNGIRGHEYLTIHVTPEAMGSYVSFESNLDFGREPSRWVGPLVECFRPEAFDVVSFIPESEVVSSAVKGYVRRKQVVETLSGYQVSFEHFYRPSPAVSRPLEIALSD